MFHVIDNLLDKNQVAAVRADAETLEFTAGERTTGAAARKVAHNLQAQDFAKKRHIS